VHRTDRGRLRRGARGRTAEREKGFVGRSAEETIKNISRIGEIGMSLVDKTLLGIMEDKVTRNRFTPGEKH
jgi:hypothetical protein